MGITEIINKPKLLIRQGQNKKTLQNRHNLATIYKKWYLLLLAGIIIALMVLLIKQAPFYQDMEHRALDYRFKLYQQEPSTDVVLVTIDEGSLRSFVEDFRISWPWPREYYAHIVDYFKLAGAKGVLFDILFYEPDLDRAEVGADYTDGRFAKAMKEYGKTVLSILFLPDSTSIPVALSRFNLAVDVSVEETIPQFPGITAPINTFLENTGAIGSVNVFPDNDGIVRKVPLFSKSGNLITTQLALSGLFHSEEDYTPESITRVGNKWYFDEKRIPVDKKGNYLINWYGTEGPQGAFRYYNFRSVIQSASALYIGRKPVLPVEVFRDKYIIIGTTAPGLRDLIPTPISQTHPGMEVWATVLSNFLHKDFIRTTSPLFSFLYLVVISFLLMTVFIHNPLRIGNFLLAVIVIIVLIIPLLAWSNNRLYIEIVSPFAALLISFMYIITISYVSEGKSKREIKKAFSRYLHPEIIERLVNNPDLVDLEGDEYEATLLFTDIYNFTNFSEKTPPKTLINLLNQYFETLTGNILDNDGMLDKFMGDGLMAVFGAPLATPKHAYNACKAALTHKKTWRDKTTDEMLPQTGYVQFHLHTRIGINSGNVVAGNMGSVRRVDYTVIGDTVNLASRLEGINKYYGTDIIISETTRNMVQKDFIIRELDFMKVKGKNEPTRIYELIDFAGSQEKSYLWIDDYAEALNLYRDGNWDKAISSLRKLSEPPVQDKVSKIMLDRCLQLKESNPTNWDGIYIWEVK